ncbi:MAG TPA: kelch-like protein [Planctomycetes bacterium]|nr:kelch-like protein [Planctomycetota bacterium]
MKVARGFCSTIRLKDGRFLLVGGGTGDVTKLGAPTATCEIYDPGTGKFSLTGSLSQARAMASLFLLPDGRVLAAGGVKGNLLSPLSLTSTEVYDPAKGTWKAGPPLAQGRAGAAECLLPDGTFFLMGGVGTGQNGSARADGEVFHP